MTRAIALPARFCRLILSRRFAGAWRARNMRNILQWSRMILPRLEAPRLFKEKTMPRFALLIPVVLLAGCAGLKEQGSVSWAHGDERVQKCMRWASESHCRDEIYGNGD
jgi:hypothetical protein